MKERKNGYYWVKTTIESWDGKPPLWEIMEWRHGQWWAIGIEEDMGDDTGLTIGPKVEPPE